MENSQTPTNYSIKVSGFSLLKKEVSMKKNVGEEGNSLEWVENLIEKTGDWVNILHENPTKLNNDGTNSNGQVTSVQTYLKSNFNWEIASTWLELMGKVKAKNK
jgi:hypothetical protein